MTSIGRTLRTNKAYVDESPVSARKQRRPRGVGSTSAGDNSDSDRTKVSQVPLTGAALAEAPARITKLSRLITLLERPDGATIAMLCEATGWQAHSVRGAIAGSLKRKGIIVISDKSGTGPRHYRIESTS